MSDPTPPTKPGLTATPPKKPAAPAAPDFVPGGDATSAQPMTRHALAAEIDRAVLAARLEERSAATRTLATVGVIAGVIIVALVVALVIVALHGTGTSNAPNPAASTPAAPATTAPAATPAAPSTKLGQGQIAPPNADPGQNWIEVKAANASANALVVDMHVDYQCPWCGIAEHNFGQGFDQLAQRGDIIYRVHLRTFVGDLIIKNDSSVRAAMAAACADTVGSFLVYSQTVFNNQPAEGTGYTDQQLTSDFATQAGITGSALTSFQQCYSGKKTHDFVVNMEGNNWNSTTNDDGATLSAPVQGTPAIFVNGKQLNLGSIMQTTSPYTPTIDASADGLLAVLHQVAGV